MQVRMLTTALALSGAWAFAQTNPRPDVEVQMVMTVADHVSHKPAPLKADSVTIMEATAVTGWQPLDGKDLELFLLIDDAANYDFGSKVPELRRFITSQPAAVAIGVAYVHDGVLQIAEKPTTDHARAARALRAPSGSKAANLYCALSDLMDRWQKQTIRREIVLVSTGMDDAAVSGGVCVNAEMAIHDAQRAGVVIYALYHPGANYLSETWSKVDSGVVDLAHVCYETGGEAYFVSHSPLDTIEPFVADIAEHLAHQYLVRFRMLPEQEGDFESIHVVPASPGVELMAPAKVWVPGRTE